MTDEDIIPSQIEAGKQCLFSDQYFQITQKKGSNSIQQMIKSAN